MIALLKRPFPKLENKRRRHPVTHEINAQQLVVINSQIAAQSRNLARRSREKDVPSRPKVLTHALKDVVQVALHVLRPPQPGEPGSGVHPHVQDMKLRIKPSPENHSTLCKDAISKKRESSARRTLLPNRCACVLHRTDRDWPTGSEHIRTGNRAGFRAETAGDAARLVDGRSQETFLVGPHGDAHLRTDGHTGGAARTIFCRTKQGHHRVFLAAHTLVPEATRCRAEKSNMTPSA